MSALQRTQHDHAERVAPGCQTVAAAQLIVIRQTALRVAWHQVEHQVARHLGRAFPTRLALQLISQADLRENMLSLCKRHVHHHLHRCPIAAWHRRI
jgi:hypothetical protein